MGENEEDLQSRIVGWQETLEREGLRVNVDKTEATVSSKEGRVWIAIHGSRDWVIKVVEEFRYLGSTISQEGGCEAGVENRIIAAWGKWREVAGVVCDEKIPIKPKVKIYSIVIRPVLIFGSETWAKLEKTDMRMLRWIMGTPVLERLEYDEIRRMAGVVKITEVIECHD
ncbi:uncharacterized protein [Palaemon carinicauda]|uniref:uncharacterized protein n=1 Tax=Palaemon carinicauda TaxID=392227 RepID=UPI0035B6A437